MQSPSTCLRRASGACSFAARLQIAISLVSRTVRLSAFQEPGISGDAANLPRRYAIHDDGVDAAAVFLGVKKSTCAGVVTMSEPNRRITTSPKWMARGRPAKYRHWAKVPPNGSSPDVMGADFGVKVFELFGSWMGRSEHREGTEGSMRTRSKR